MTFDCSICYERLDYSPNGSSSSSQSEVSCTPCGHIFHKKCLDEWLKTSNSNQSCPSCRSGLGRHSRTFAVLPDKTPSSPITSDPTASRYEPTIVLTRCDTPKSSQSGRKSKNTPRSASSSPSECRHHKCIELKHLHNDLIKDFQQLKEKREAQSDQWEIVPAKISSLKEEKEKHAKLVKAQAEQIRNLLKKTHCACQDKTKLDTSSCKKQKYEGAKLIRTTTTITTNIISAQQSGSVTTTSVIFAEENNPMEISVSRRSRGPVRLHTRPRSTHVAQGVYFENFESDEEEYEGDDNFFG